ncbi:helix-turn-helix domain-containing protein [Paenibacillus sp. P36]|uniref:helix-turn-helix domain-containing protein n=1 Tax=Paenibacillus sp. P36 TaxID=3342538 RepID=UPI0038B33FBB
MNGQLEFLFHTKRDQHIHIAPHQHQCYELVYYLSGSGTTRIGDVIYPYQANTFTLIQPHTLHDERHETDTDVFFIGFQKDTSPYTLQEGLYADYENNPILAYLQAMGFEMKHKRSFYMSKLNHLVSELIIELLRLDDLVTSEPNADKIIYAKNYIDENYSQQIRVDTLAQLVGYSYDRFRHLYKEKYGLSPIHYLMSKRISAAKRLLLQTKLPITDVADACGFSTDAQFCSLFKQATGLTPRQFRVQE